MHITHVLGTVAICAGFGLFFTAGTSAPPSDAGFGGVGNAIVPPATGHFVLVIEGDRDQLTITHASHKVDPWAGVQKGLTSEWSLSILDASGAVLQTMPLDLSKFDLAPNRKGKPLRVEGCVVHDSRIAMLANAPTFGAAASYVFKRGQTIVGTVEADRVNQLAGNGR